MQVRHEVGEFLQVAHGDSQAVHIPDVAPSDNVNPDAQP